MLSLSLFVSTHSFTHNAHKILQKYNGLVLNEPLPMRKICDLANSSSLSPRDSAWVAAVLSKATSEGVVPQKYEFGKEAHDHGRLFAPGLQNASKHVRRFL